MYQSEQINELAAALAKAQGKIKPAMKNKKNPHFKSLYADLDSIWEACKEPLSENGLSVMQTIVPTQNGMNLVTTLAHASGQWIRSEMPIIAQKQDAQGIGSALTYYRRYTLASMVGVAPGEDLDAEERKEESHISAQQMEKIVQLANGDHSIIDRILEHNGVKRLEDVPLENYERVIKWLHAIKSKGGQ